MHAVVPKTTLPFGTMRAKRRGNYEAEDAASDNNTLLSCVKPFYFVKCAAYGEVCIVRQLSERGR